MLRHLCKPFAGTDQKPSRSSTLLDTLMSLQYVYDSGARQDKLQLLQSLATARLRTADKVFRLIRPESARALPGYRDSSAAPSIPG